MRKKKHAQRVRKSVSHGEFSRCCLSGGAVLGRGRGLGGKKADAKLYHGSKIMGLKTMDLNPWDPKP